MQSFFTETLNIEHFLFQKWIFMQADEEILNGREPDIYFGTSLY